MRLTARDKEIIVDAITQLIDAVAASDPELYAATPTIAITDELPFYKVRETLDPQSYGAFIWTNEKPARTAIVINPVKISKGGIEELADTIAHETAHWAQWAQWGDTKCHSDILGGLPATPTNIKFAKEHASIQAQLDHCLRESGLYNHLETTIK